MTTQRCPTLKWVFLLAAFACGFTAPSPVSGAPYQQIVERNLFALHAPVPSVVEHPSAAPALPKITLTGITTILGRKLIFLTMTSTKPGAAPDSMILTEGQTWNEIEVQSIDEKAGQVKVVNHGQSQTLNFEQDSARPVSSSAQTSGS